MPIAIQPPAAPPATAPAPARPSNALLLLAVAWVYRALVWTLRIRVENPERLVARETGGTHIFIFWHNRLLLFPAIWRRFLLGNRPLGVTMISASRDGEMITQFLGRFGLKAVRGSANRGGSAALRELVGWLRRGHDIGITPDGSRGPCYEMKPGLVLLAQLSGRPLLPISLDYSSAWRLKSWDRFFIPKPFSRVTFIVGEPLLVPRTANAEEFEAERQRCEQVMLAQVRQR